MEIDSAQSRKMRRSLLDEEEEGTPIASRQREQDRQRPGGGNGIVAGAESQEKGVGGHGPKGARAGLLNLRRSREVLSLSLEQCGWGRL